MPSAPRLPHMLHDKLLKTLADVYREATGAFSAADRPTADVARDVAASILLSTKEALARAAREQNRRPSLHNCLPNELWCLIWEGMPFSDRMAITHVCGDWRAAAVRFPALWNDLTFFTTIHDSHCECNACVGLSKDHTQGQPRTSFPDNSSNIDYAPTLLSRGCGSPLSVTLYIIPCEASLRELSLLARYVTEHAQRLINLSVYTPTPESAVHVLRKLAVLPSLRRLSLQVLTGYEDFWLPDFAGPSFISLPGIEALEMSYYFMWPQTQRFESLRALSIAPPDFQTERACFEALNACPHLLALSLNFSYIASRPFDYTLDFESRDGWGTPAPRLRSLKIIDPPHGTWTKAFLQIWPALQSRYIEYPSRTGLIGGDVGDIFCSLGRSTHICVTHTSALLTVQISDENKGVRCVSAVLEGDPSHKDLSAVVSHVPHNCWQTVTTLTADASLWVLIDGDFLASANALQTLRLVVDKVPLSDLHVDDLFARQRPESPALRSLVLTCGTRALTVCPEDIDAFIRHLDISLPLRVLEVDHRLIKGDASILRDLAASVVIGVCHVP